MSSVSHCSSSAPFGQARERQCYIFEYVPVGILNCARQAQGTTNGSPAPVDPVLATFSQAESQQRISTCTCVAPLPMPSLWLDAPDAHTHTLSLLRSSLPVVRHVEIQASRPARRNTRRVEGRPWLCMHDVRWGRGPGHRASFGDSDQLPELGCDRASSSSDSK